MGANLVRARDVAEVVPYSEQHDRTRMPAPNQFIIERHEPAMFDAPFHHHTSVEINFLRGCEMEYSFSGVPVRVTRDSLTIFWGAQPHRVISVSPGGEITNLYLSLGQFLRWGLPEELVQAILAGTVIAGRTSSFDDTGLMDRLWNERERDRENGAWRRTHLDEISNRLRRLGLEGWDVLLDPRSASSVLDADVRTMNHVEALLRFIADNFNQPVSIADIAAGVSLSAGRAMTLFKEVMGVSIKHHLTRTRLSHAKMLLSETDQKIVNLSMDSGFGSLSSFYDAFAEHNEGMSPAKYRRTMRRG